MGPFSVLWFLAGVGVGIGIASIVCFLLGRGTSETPPNPGEFD